MWNRLQGRIGGRGIAVLAVALLALVVGVVLVLGSGEEESPAEPQAAVSGATPAEPDTSTEKDGEPAGTKKPSEPGAGAPTPAPSGVPEQFVAFQDCVRENGGKPIDLSSPPADAGDGGPEREDSAPGRPDDDVPPALEDYTPRELEALREARAACIDELPGEIRDRAEQIAASPFRSCMSAEQEAGKDLVEAAEACRDEIPEGEGDELPPGFGDDGPFGGDRPEGPRGESPPGG